MKKWLPAELEEISCDFCGSKKVIKEFKRADNMNVVECAVCGLAYLNPRPKPDCIMKFYDEDYFTGESANRGEGGLRCDIDHSSIQLHSKTKIMSRTLEIINERFGGLSGKDILEIGCATGDFLMDMRREGAHVIGLEISDFAASIARKRGLNVITGTVEDYATKNSPSFDIVIACEVIEHVLSPTRFLGHVAHLIRPGGLLLLSTPNYACTKRFGSEWFGFNASFEHIYFFSLESLKNITSKFGLHYNYVESSIYLGEPKRSLSFLRKHAERFKTLSFFISEIGLYKTLSVIVKKRKRIYESCIGHTFLSVFVKLK